MNADSSVVLLGFTIPDSVASELIQQDPHPPHQTHNFANAFVAALRSAGLDIQLISALPVSAHPGSPVLVAPGGEFQICPEVKGRYVPFVNLPVLKHATRFVSLLGKAGRAARATRTSTLVVHGVHSPFLAFARLVKRLYRKKLVAVITDPPGVILPEDNYVIGLLKRFDRGVVRRLLRGFDGAICLSPGLRDLLVDDRTKSLIIEGFLADDLLSFNRGTPSGKPEIVYAGGLQTEYGAGTLLRAAQHLRTPGASVAFYGRGPLAQEIGEAAARDIRVRGPEFKSREELFAAYARAWLLVQPRPAGTSMASQSFPSKLIEYLATGVPTASTVLPGMPADYEGKYIPLSDRDALTMAAELDAALAESQADAWERGAAAREFVRETRSAEAQGRTLRAFIEALRSA